MDALKGVNSQSLRQLEVSVKEKDLSVNFSRVLKDTIEKVDALQKTTDEAIQEFSVGKGSLHETMIALEKANISFEFMIQVRNKIVTAYEEIMRMQL